EYIRERSTDYGAETELGKCPGGVFARAAATEVIAGEKDFCLHSAGSIQEEIRVVAAIGVVAPVAEEFLVQPFLRSGFQEARGDDLVRIDVVDRKRCERGLERNEGL